MLVNQYWRNLRHLLGIVKASGDAAKLAAADSKKLSDEEIKRLESVAAKNSELEKLFIESTKEGVDQKIALFELEFEEKERKLLEAGVTEGRIEKIKQQGLQEIRDTFSAKSFNDSISLSNKLQANEISQAENSIQNKEELEKKKFEIHLKYLEIQLAATKEFAGSDGKITEEEKAGIEAIELAIAKVRQGGTKQGETPTSVFQSMGLTPEQEQDAMKTIAAVQSAIASLGEVISDGFKVRINQIESERDAEIQAVEESVGSHDSKQERIKQINAKFNKEKYEAEKAAFETNQAIQIIQAIVSTALGIVSGLNAGYSLGPAGVVMGPVLAALAAATGVAQIAVIASQKPPPTPSKFATGVIGLDGQGTSTSDSIDAKLSRGESVITAKATRAFHRELAQMEMAVGNTPNYNFSSGKFATGVIGDGGFSTRGILDSSTELQTLRTAIREGFTNAPQPVVSVVEIQKVNTQRNRSIAVSEL